MLHLKKIIRKFNLNISTYESQRNVPFESTYVKQKLGTCCGTAILGILRECYNMRYTVLFQLLIIEKRVDYS